MKVRNAGKNEDEKVEVQMTPMIDIVFQLLVFFIMTFKIVAQEGDFSIKMPLAAPSEATTPEDELPPMKVRLTALGKSLNTIEFNGEVMKDFSHLHQRLTEVVGGPGEQNGPSSRREDAEVELDCDYNLRYEFVIQAVTSVSGQRGEDGSITKLVEKIKFAQPRTKN